MDTELVTTGRVAGSLYADVYGREGGRAPIVLLHGLTFDRRIWAPIIDALQARDPARRIIALDLPGHGESPARPPHDLPRVADVVHEALEAVGATTPLLVGHSMSGALASMYASKYPTAGVVSVDQLPFIREFAALLRRLEPQLRGPGFANVFRDVFAASFHTELLPPAARALVESNCRPGQELVLSYWRMAMENPVEDIEALIDDGIDTFARKQLPYLLVVGSDIPMAAREVLEQRVPTLRIVEWPGTGHFPHLAHPVEFAELLIGSASEGLHPERLLSQPQ